jgi:hypothetical protein
MRFGKTLSNEFKWIHSGIIMTKFPKCRETFFDNKPNVLRPWAQATSTLDRRQLNWSLINVVAPQYIY